LYGIFLVLSSKVVISEGRGKFCSRQAFKVQVDKFIIFPYQNFDCMTKYAWDYHSIIGKQFGGLKQFIVT
jgi:hypothetical protein